MAGLNTDLDELRGQILGKDPLPSIREVFWEVKREESYGLVMMRQKSHNITHANFALNATETKNSSPNVTAIEAITMSNKKISHHIVKVERDDQDLVQPL